MMMLQNMTCHSISQTSIYILASSSTASFFVLLLFYSAVLAIWFFDFIIFATSFWFAKGVSNSLAWGVSLARA